ncbi:MAG: hypothetical protein RML95_01000 [Anaerolineae bacterium]|nr:hypothetical protein [Anaerolineae bacterium]MDW8297890.1 hypothetical protein [Anaerolineae bacterium]
MSQFYRNQPPEQPPHEPEPPRSYKPEDYLGTSQPERPMRHLYDILIAQLPPWLPRDLLLIGALITAGTAGSLCLLGFCLLITFSESLIPRPSTPTLAVVATVTPIFVTATPEASPVPFYDTSRIGSFLNPFIDANLEGMQVLVIEVLDPVTGSYVRSAPISANTLEMQQFITAFNIAQAIVAPDLTCPDHVRFLIARADGSFISIGACLKGVVILRGAALPNLGGNDLPMGPYFTDILTPYLPSTYQALLQR